MLITRTSFPNFPIVDSDTLEQWLRIDSGADASTVELLLASATDYIEGVIGQVICAANYSVTIDALEPCIPLNLFPINSISSVIARLADGTTQPLIANTDYVARIVTNTPSITVLHLPTTAISVTVALNAGYNSSAAVPPALQQAAAVLVAGGYDGRNALDPATIATVANLTARHRRIAVA